MTGRGRTEPLPSPRAHLAATLRLLDGLVPNEGPWPGADVVRGVLDRPRDLPVSVAADQNGLKYDAYRTHGPDGPAWGIAFNERWQGRAVWRSIEQLAKDLPGDYDVASVRRLRGAVPSPSVNVSVGFDAPGRPPRLKIYLQEADWEQGVVTVDGFAALDADLRGHCTLPRALDGSRALGVLTVVLHPDGTRGLKAYFGGERPTDAADGLLDVPEVRVLCDGLAQCCPSRAWHYLTVRMRADEPARYALNRIWDHTRVGFSTPAALSGAWGEVRALFARAGQTDAFAEIRAAVDALADLRVVPTASAFERGGTSADVYLAAWPR